MGDDHLDVAIVYILYAIDGPEIEAATVEGSVQVFVCVVVVLAVAGSANNIGR